jgi:hypothetical protein
MSEYDEAPPQHACAKQESINARNEEERGIRDDKLDNFEINFMESTVGFLEED